MHWGSTCLQVCSSGPPAPNHANRQTTGLHFSRLKMQVSVCQPQKQNCSSSSSGHLHGTPHSQAAPHPKKHNSKQLEESQRVKKEGLHAGEHGCHVLCL